MNNPHDEVLEATSSSYVGRHELVVERARAASVTEIFDAWTQHFGTWFASPGEQSMNAVPGEPYWFNVVHEGERCAHYGKFLRVEVGRLTE